MPGYPQELFLVAPPDLYSCGICRDVLQQPKQCLHGHAYCSDCMHTHLAINPACPTCACPLTEASMANCLLLRDLIGGMLVRCPTSLPLAMPLAMSLRDQEHVNSAEQEDQENDDETAGCTWTGSLDEQEGHTQRDCPYAPVRCPHDGCSLLIQRRLIAKHDDICIHKLLECNHCHENLKLVDQQQHDRFCAMKPFNCPVGCGTQTTRNQFQEHLDKSCPLQKVICPHVGCGELIQRGAYETHDAQCSHKPSICCLCGVLVKRVDEEVHAACACPKRLTTCPRECGDLLPFDDVAQHLSDCPLEEVVCPHAAGMGCSTTCRGRMQRRDLEAHLIEPSTLVATISRLQQQVRQCTLSVDLLTTKLEVAEREYETMTATLTEQMKVNKKLTVQVLKKSCNISWATQPCPESEAIIDDQLSQQKKADGETWSTYHFSQEIPGSCFSDICKPCRFESKRIKLHEGGQLYLEFERKRRKQSVDCYFWLIDFPGDAEYSITAFRFGKGAPKTLRGKTLSKQCPTYLNFFDENDIVSAGWLSKDSTVPILVTVHIRR